MAPLATLLATCSIAAVVHMKSNNATTQDATENVIVLEEETNKPPPHLVMMVIDDLGWSDVGYHGSNFPTPNIDQLASEGVKLEKYYVQQVCSPTRSALVTARYPFRTGLQHTTTLTPGSHSKIPSDTATIAEVLKTAGYSTHAIGKWHVGYSSWADTPIGRGFDSYTGYLQGGEDYYSHSISPTQLIPVGNLSIAGFDMWHNRTAAWETSGKYSTDVFMDEAQRVLDTRNPEQPMFMYFAHQEIHAPDLKPPDSASIAACAGRNWTSPIGPEVTKLRGTLCSMASNLDASIGRFVDMLKAKNMWENTVLWLTTDNGGMTYGVAEDGVGSLGVSVSSNWPLRGGKATLFEGGVRGVSFVAGGFLPAAARGKTRTELMQHVDIPATMAKLAGAEWTKAPTDGLDVWDAVVHGAPSNRVEVPINVDTCVGVTGGPPCSLRESKYNALISSKWKLIEANWNFINCPNSTWCTGAGFYDGWWTNEPMAHVPYNASQAAMPVRGLKNGGLWLFDLSVDPHEERNVAAENPAVVKTMRDRLATLAEPANGYKDPQRNIPDPRSLPGLHNKMWAPFRRFGEEDPPMPAEYVDAVVAAAATAYWD